MDKADEKMHDTLQQEKQEALEKHFGKGRVQFLLQGSTLLDDVPTTMFRVQLVGGNPSAPAIYAAYTPAEYEKGRAVELDDGRVVGTILTDPIATVLHKGIEYRICR
jgi:hypothetical protein